ncbi:TPA: hypothetical protein ACH3X3_002722 [Trebouxia sp. C0006]
MSSDIENSSAQALPSRQASKDKIALQPSTSANVQGAKAIEDIYQKKSQLEHILLRPDTYIGSTEKKEEKLWVHHDDQLVQQEISYAPGLYKIFDEILVNAADNKVRDPKMDTLKVDISAEDNRICVWNNGDGVPVEIHKEEKVYVPELIFGHLLTSSNYNDDEQKVTGGRNGYGAKLTNIFSTEFIVETCDGQRGRRYKQVVLVFNNNMSKKSEPKITSCKSSDNWTSITFSPDLAKFGMESLEEHAVMLMRKRVYDMAGVLGKTVKVFLNGNRVPVKTFQDYVNLYLSPGTQRIYEKLGDRWEVCISLAEQGQFQQVSFVNSICTVKGGTHVDLIANQICKTLADNITKNNGKGKNKSAKLEVRPFMVKNYLWVFVNSMITNPTFDSQTKETMTLRSNAFGSKPVISESLLKKVEGLVKEHILEFANLKQNKELAKTDGSKRSRIRGLPKLNDANNAGTKHSEDCTLILTEGDSAMSLAVAGLAVIGRDSYGVFPLRGKLLNVRDASAAQIAANAEIQAIKQIMGLQHGKVYTDVKQLRYGHLMIMTDQDHDGSHIKGLIMNYFHTFYPSLMKLPGFLIEFITPVIKARKGRQTLAFYTMPEYEMWKEETNTSGWDIKYYKGLGTSTREEAKEYFADIEEHRKTFVWAGGEDGTALEMAFSRKKIEERKAWLRSFVPGTYLDHTASDITYTDFVNKELILFSRADLERSIPSMLDGLKPGQRKILFGCFKRNLSKDIKVSQLAGYVSEHSAYHHGDVSLTSTIVGMAQNFVGSNNINLLYPSGQFGTRLQGGKDSASARYIFTRMTKLTRHLFNGFDDRLLSYLSEEGQQIEPEWYMPILPLVLINGAEGIGTGWSTSIPNYNPRDLVDNMKRLLNGQEAVEMQPWYRSFSGQIMEVPSKTAGKSYNLNGVVSQRDATTLEVTELPIRKWTQDYKEFLETLIKPEDKSAPALLEEYKEYHTDTEVHFQLFFTAAKLQEVLSGGGPHQKLKLIGKASIGNMMLFGPDGLIKRYETPQDILLEFFHVRMQFYHKRRAFLIQAAGVEQMRCNNKTRFILAVVASKLKVSNRKRADIEEQLVSDGFDKMPNRGATALTGPPTQDSIEDTSGCSYDYLLSMPIQNLTIEKVEKLKAEAASQEAEVARLHGTTVQQLYLQDLDAFSEAYEAWEADEAANSAKLSEQQRRALLKNGKKPGKAGKAAKKVKAESDSEDMSGSEEEFRVKPKGSKGKKALAAACPPPKPSTNVIAPTAPSLVVPAASSSQGRGRAKKGQTAVKSEEEDMQAGPSSSQPDAASQQEAERAVAAVLTAGVDLTEDADETAVPLLDRLAGQMDALKVESSKSQSSKAHSAVRSTAAAVKTAKPARAAAKKAASYVDLLDSDDENMVSDGDVNSPAPAAVKPGKASRPRAPPANQPKAKPPVAPAAGDGAKAVAKRKLQQTKLPVSKQVGKQGAEAQAEVSGSNEPEAASPVVLPKGKVRRMRPSPFNKASGASKSRLAAPPAASHMASQSSRLSDSEEEDENVEVAPRARAAPRRAAVASKTYIDIDESDSDVISLKDGSEGSDFEL